MNGQSRHDFHSAHQQLGRSHENVMKAVGLLNEVVSFADASGENGLANDARRVRELLCSDLDCEAEMRELLETVARNFVSLQKRAVSILLSRELVKAVDTFLDANVYRKFGVSIGKTPAASKAKLPRLVSGQILTDFDNSRLFDPTDAADELAMANAFCTLTGQHWLLRALPHQLGELESNVTTTESYKWLKTTVGDEQLYSRRHRTEAQKRRMVRTLLQLQNAISVAWSEAGKEPSDVPLFFIPLFNPALPTAEQNSAVAEAKSVIRAAAEAYRPPASPQPGPSTAELMSDATMAERYQLFVKDATQNRMKRNQEAHVGLFRNCNEGELHNWLDETGLRFLVIAHACLHEDDGSGLINQLLPEPTSAKQYREPKAKTDAEASRMIEIDPVQLSRDWIVLSEKERGDRLLAQWTSQLKLQRGAQLAQGTSQPAQVSDGVGSSDITV